MSLWQLILKLLNIRKPLAYSHPEEIPDYKQTLENVTVQNTVSKWLTVWQVPIEHWQYWRDAIVIKVTNDIQYPAQTWWGVDGKRYMDCRPEWLNPGVIAHEQAHNSYALLSAEQKISWLGAYKPYIIVDPLIKKLWYEKMGNWPVGTDLDIEMHAEIYRFLWPKVPEILKGYYPKLV